MRKGELEGVGGLDWEGHHAPHSEALGDKDGDGWAGR